MSDCGAQVSETNDPHRGPGHPSIPEHLNRCLTVTDKRHRTWQKRAIRRKGGALKSVCRELPRLALAA